MRLLSLAILFPILVAGPLSAQEKATPATDSAYSAKGDSGMSDLKRVTGIGGVFFKCDDPDKMREWYAKHLGLKTDQYGTLFESRNTDNPEQKTYLQWSPFTASTKYFEPSQKQYMINYRVDNLEALLEILKKEGVQIVGEMEVFEYGKFAHIMDPEGNEIELWEPVDSEFTKSYDGKTTH